jgi:hypothetical protein
LWSRRFANESRTSDQYDDFSIAAWLFRADRDGSLAAFLNPALSPPERTLTQVEGWLLGVRAWSSIQNRNFPWMKRRTIGTRINRPLMQKYHPNQKSSPPVKGSV